MKNISPYLTFAGTIPFILGAILISMGVDTFVGLGQTVHVLSIYGLVIASFMAGAHWGCHLSLSVQHRWAARLPVVSNVIALVLWLGFLSLSSAGFMWLLIAAFMAMLMVDYGLQRAQVIDEAYFKVRVSVILVVVTTLIVAALQLMS